MDNSGLVGESIAEMLYSQYRFRSGSALPTVVPAVDAGLENNPDILDDSFRIGAATAMVALLALSIVMVNGTRIDDTVPDAQFADGGMYKPEMMATMNNEAFLSSLSGAAHLGMVQSSTPGSRAFRLGVISAQTGVAGATGSLESTPEVRIAVESSRDGLPVDDSRFKEAYGILWRSTEAAQFDSVAVASIDSVFTDRTTKAYVSLGQTLETMRLLGEQPASANLDAAWENVLSRMSGFDIDSLGLAADSRLLAQLSDLQAQAAVKPPLDSAAKRSVLLSIQRINVLME